MVVVDLSESPEVVTTSKILFQEFGVRSEFVGVRHFCPRSSSKCPSSESPLVWVEKNVKNVLEKNMWNMKFEI